MNEKENALEQDVPAAVTEQAESEKADLAGDAAPKKSSSAPRKKAAGKRKAAEAVTDTKTEEEGTAAEQPQAQAPEAAEKAEKKKPATRRRTPKAAPVVEEAEAPVAEEIPLAAADEAASSVIAEATPAAEAASESTENEAPAVEETPAPAKKKARRSRAARTQEEKAAPAEESATTALVLSDEQKVDEATPAVCFPEAVANIKRSFFARIALILAIVLVFGVSTFIYYNRPAVYTEKTNSVNFFYVFNEDKTVITVNGTVRESVPGELAVKSQNGHGDVCAALIGQDLYIISGKAVIKIAESVVDFVLSANGNVVAYRTSPSFLYYRETGEKATPSLLSRECYDAAYCLSADGKQLVYTAGLGEEAKMRVESYAGTRPYIPAVDACRPIAVANGCDYIYYLNAEGALVVFDRARDLATVVATAPDATSFAFNRDFTELLLVENGKTVLVANGEAQQSVFDGAETALQLVANNRVVQRGLANGKQYMMTTFYKNYYLLARDGSLYLRYLNRKGEWMELSRVDEAASVTVTDKRVFFMLTNAHGSVELLAAKVGKSAITRIDWDVTNYCPNVDGSRVLFTRDENALYLYRPEFGNARMADCILPQTLTVTADDLFCYIDDTGALCVSENGAAPRVLSSTALFLVVDAHTLYYTTDQTEQGTYTVFVNYRAERLVKSLFAGVSSIS